MAYFDNAATTYPKPNEVYNFMDNFYRNNGGSAGRGDYALAKTGGASADSVPRSAPHLRHSRAGGRRGCENPVGNLRSYKRQFYAGYLYACDHRYAEKRFRYRGELYG